MIANAQPFTGKNMVILFVILQIYKEGIRVPIVLALHVNVSDCKLCFVHKMSSQTISSSMKFDNDRGVIFMFKM